MPLPRLVVPGHALVPSKWAKDRYPKLFRKYRAFCSCGAWCDVIPMASSKSQSKANRNWHNEHKFNVLQSQGKIED